MKGAIRSYGKQQAAAYRQRYNFDRCREKLMVIGTEVEREDDENIYDYVGVPFPEGYIDSEIMFLFMHDDIESIDFVGFINSGGSGIQKPSQRVGR